MYSNNFELRLMQGPHVRCVVSELNIDAIDIVYPMFFHQRLSNTYFYNIRSWNGIRIIAHFDDIETMGFQTVTDWSVNDPYSSVSN